ncbi:steroid Delta-isomerase [Pseudomonas sp. BMS12]|uniref:steroid Delta-isomerase n=1 Tax=Pseudomonas sp. BMS12 TaxID=1796033 RepID=UPI00083B5333|nr:steroid Delta-isomerase [Pseudomonas sp. BMS12]
MTVEAKRAAMQRYVERVDAGDIDGILALYADDAIVEDPVGTPALVGRTAIERFYREGLGRSNARARLTGPVRVAGNSAAMPFRVELEWDGKPCAIEVIDVMEFAEDGRFQSMKAYWGPDNLEQGR